jgi:hypothetical protein
MRASSFQALPFNKRSLRIVTLLTILRILRSNYLTAFSQLVFEILLVSPTDRFAR